MRETDAGLVLIGGDGRIGAREDFDGFRIEAEAEVFAGDFRDAVGIGGKVSEIGSAGFFAEEGAVGKFLEEELGLFCCGLRVA